MPPVHGSKAKVYGAGFDISSFLRRGNPQRELDTEEVSVLGRTFKEYVIGLEDGRLTLEGLFFGGTNELDAILAANMGVQTLWNHLGSGDVLGLRGMSQYGKLRSYTIDTPVAGAATCSAEIQSDTGGEPTVILKVFDSSVVDQVNIDDGAGSTSGAVGFLQVAAGTALVVKIRHSTDNITYTDLITFASASTRQVQRVEVAGTINRYVKVASVTGTGTFWVGFRRK